VPELAGAGVVLVGPDVAVPVGAGAVVVVGVLAARFVDTTGVDVLDSPVEANGLAVDFLPEVSTVLLLATVAGFMLSFLHPEIVMNDATETAMSNLVIFFITLLVKNYKNQDRY
jgi:hypothetical protein